MTDIITYHRTEPVIRNSEGNTCLSPDPASFFDFLIYSCPAKPLSTLRVAWSLASLLQPALSQLPSSVRKSLTETNKATWGNYRLFYIPSKLFSVNKSHDEITLYELAQYFPEDDEPRTIQELQQKAELLLATLVQLGIPNPTTLASPVACFEASGLLNEYETIPTIWDTPDFALQAFEYALQSSGREWVSNYQVGCWEELHSYDIASAYPGEATKLIDLRDCEYWKSDTFGSREDGAYYGFVYGDLHLDPSHPFAFCSPVLTCQLDGTLVNAVGNLPRDFYCLDTIRFVNRYRMGEFKFKSGWFVHPYGGVRPRFPFKRVMDDLFEMRSLSDLASYCIKRVMNGIIGRLLESYANKDGNVTKYGKLYNPIYHSLILNRTAIHVAEFIIENGIAQPELVHVGIDGIKTTKFLIIPSASRMGHWRYTGSELTCVLSPAGILTKQRFADLLVETMRRPTAYKLGRDSEYDLRKLFLKQNRKFKRLPHNGLALLGKYMSEAIVLWAMWWISC